MARHLSVEKRARQNLVRNRRNRVVKSRIRGAFKEVDAAQDAEQKKKAALEAQSTLDRAVTKGVIHRHKASRLKSRIMKRQAASSE